MPERSHVSPDGVKYRLVASRTTTPATDTSAKEITVDSTSIEVIISDYSRTHEKPIKIDKHTYFYGGVVRLTNTSIRTGGNLWRDNLGLVLSVSPAEKEKG